MSDEKTDILIAMVVGTFTFTFLITIIVVILFRYMRQNRKQQDELFKAVLNAQEEERKRVARDIHDSLGGLLSGAKIRIGEIITNKVDEPFELQSSLEVIQDYISRAAVEARNASNALTPEVINNSGIKNAIASLANEYTAYFNVQLTNQMPENLSLHCQLQLYRIFQEMFNNSLKYSNAGSISLKIVVSGKLLEIDFTDDGLGFRKEDINPQSSGIRNIEKRVEYMKGKMILDSSNGTHYLLKFNLNELL